MTGKQAGGLDRLTFLARPTDALDQERKGGDGLVADRHGPGKSSGPQFRPARIRRVDSTQTLAGYDALANLHRQFKSHAWIDGLPQSTAATPQGDHTSSQTQRINPLNHAGARSERLDLIGSGEHPGSI